MSEEIVRDVDTGLPAYVTAEQLDDDYEKLRITNNIVDALANKKVMMMQMPVRTVAEMIPNMPEYGAFILCVQGTESSMPSRVYACVSNGVASTVASLASQAGDGLWNAVDITVAASSGNFTILQNSGTIGVGNFYITVLGYF